MCKDQPNSIKSLVGQQIIELLSEVSIRNKEVKKKFLSFWIKTTYIRVPNSNAYLQLALKQIFLSLQKKFQVQRN